MNVLFNNGIILGYHLQQKTTCLVMHPSLPWICHRCILTTTFDYLLSFSTHTWQYSFPLNPDESFLVTMTKCGYMGNRALHPSCAFSMKTVDSFDIVNSQAPQLGIQKFTRILCSISMVIWTSPVSDSYLLYVPQIMYYVATFLWYIMPAGRCIVKTSF